MTQYITGLTGKKIAVIGMGVSNAPLVTLLCEHGLSVTVRDRASRNSVAQRAAEFEALGAKLILGEGYLEHLTEDIIFRTPGLSPNTPELLAAGEEGSEITSEMALFFAHCPCHILAVTGSDGKTTTTSIIAEMLKAAGHKIFVGGNIGNPLLPQIDEMSEKDWAVIELSSFQLMDMNQSPEIAVFTNLTPNHLDYHHSMQEYQHAKTNIFAYQTKNQRAIFNFDNPITHQLAQTAPGNITLFSRQQEISNPEISGLELFNPVYLKNHAIWRGEEEILPVNQILLPGVHNIENYMAAIAALENLVSNEVICSVAQNFGGVPHRMQLVRELNGVRYYNDSIGSSPNRTIAGLQSFSSPVILIAGGYDKGVEFDQVANQILRSVKSLHLTGNTANKIQQAIHSDPDFHTSQIKIKIHSDFDGAVLAACGDAETGDSVVLSPACASFDQFQNFVERCNRFCQIIASLESEETT